MLKPKIGYSKGAATLAARHNTTRDRSNPIVWWQLHARVVTASSNRDIWPSTLLQTACVTGSLCGRREVFQDSYQKASFKLSRSHCLKMFCMTCNISIVIFVIIRFFFFLFLFKLTHPKGKGFTQFLSENERKKIFPTKSRQDLNNGTLNDRLFVYSIQI